MSEKRHFGPWTSKRDFLAGMAALAAGIALVVGACAGIGGDFGGDLAGGGFDAPCRDTLGKPLQARDVVAAFEAEGFTMTSLPESFYCNPENFGGGGAAVADVSNRSDDLADEISDRQGWATCTVHADAGEPPYELDADLHRGADSPIYAGTKAVFDLANVGCSLYPPDEDAELWVGRAHAAMKRLERQLAS